MTEDMQAALDHLALLGSMLISEDEPITNGVQSIEAEERTKALSTGALVALNSLASTAALLVLQEVQRRQAEGQL